MASLASRISNSSRYTGTTLIFGAVPPPIGGVSVFLGRRANQLSKNGCKVEFMDWSNAGFAARLQCVTQMIFSTRIGESEVHGYQSLPLLLSVMRMRNRNSSLWLHSGQFSGSLNPWQRKILQLALRHLPKVVFVSPHIADILKSNGYDLPPNPTIQHAFIAPDRSREPMLWNQYDQTVRDFVARSSPLLVMQGSDAFHESVDRYGTDIAIEALPAVLDAFPSAGLLVGRPSSGSPQFEEYRQRLYARIGELGVSDSVYFLEREQELFPIIARANLFLRPSNQDGDSVSIREASFLGIPVVASDACPRLPTCTLFSSRNVRALSDAIVGELMQRVKPTKRMTAQEAIEDAV